MCKENLGRGSREGAGGEGAGGGREGRRASPGAGDWRKINK